MAFPYFVKNFSNGVNVPRLKKEIALSTIMIGLIEIKDLAIRIDIKFEDKLTNGENATLNTILENHDGAPDPDSAVNNITATTDPTVNDDINAGYSKLSRWVNTVSEIEFTCLNPSTGGAVWKETTQQDTGGKTVIYTPAHTPAASYISTGSESYIVTKIKILYGGSTALGTITKIEAIVHRNSGISMDIKIHDVTNGNDIAEKTGITDTIETIHNLGSISNVPTDPAIFEIHILVNGMVAEARVSGVSIIL